MLNGGPPNTCRQLEILIPFTGPIDSMLLSDRPIICAAEDQLGFQPFSATLAKGLREMAPAEGLVVALHAPWGSGKTSALNLIERHLAVLDVAQLTGKSIDEIAELAAASSDNLSDEKNIQLSRQWSNLSKQHRQKFRTTVVRFSPWYFSGQEALFKAFFGVMGTALDIANETAVAKAFAAILKRGAEAGGAIGAGMGLAAGGPAGAAGGATIGGLFGKLLNDKFDRTESLDALLEKLREALQSSDRRILVIIDDVDRLLPDELRQILSLIKSLGNLPNITYLLAYDQDEAEKLLKRAGIDNSEYMEKIVQVSFQLPRVDRSSLQSMLFARLDAIRKNKPLENARRWGEAFLMHIDPYLKTPRHVTRLCNSLQVTWPAIEDEVDWSDLVSLEILRLHEPRYYSLILDNLDALTGATSSLLSSKSWSDKLVPNSSDCPDPERLKTALKQLFPRLAKEWKESSWDATDEVGARRDRRLQSPDYARNYFALAPSADQFQASEIRALLKSPKPDPDYASLFEKAKTRLNSKKITMVARLLDQIAEEITDKTPLSTELARAILKRSKEAAFLRDEERHFFAIDNRQRMRWVFASALRCTKNEDRAKKIKSWFDGTNGYGFLVPFVESLTGDEASRSSDDLIPPSERGPLRKLALRLVTKASAHPDFSKYDLSPMLLFSWARLSDFDTPSRWLESKMSEAEVLVELARIIPHEVHSSSDGVRYVVDRAAWSKLLDIQKLAEKLSEVRSPETAEVLDRFQAALSNPDPFRGD